MRGFAWASGCRMPLDFYPVQMRDRMREVFRVNEPYPPGIHIDDTGSKWPDLLGCGDGTVNFFASEKVLRSLQDAKIELLNVIEVPISDFSNKRLKLEEAPRYYILEAPPGLAPDYERMGVPTSADGKPILPLPKGFPPSPYLYRPDSWTGLDLFSCNSGAHHMFATERIHLMSKAQKWTNARFQSIGRYTLAPRT